MLPVLSLLVQDGQDVGLLDGNGYTAFRIAAEERYITVTECLLDNSVSINAASEGGNTPLYYYAVAGCHEETFQFLINQGADIDAIDNQGRTLLHLACQHEKLDMCMFLIRANAHYDRRQRVYSPTYSTGGLLFAMLCLQMELTPLSGIITDEQLQICQRSTCKKCTLGWLLGIWRHGNQDSELRRGTWVPSIPLSGFLDFFMGNQDLLCLIE